MCFVKTKIPDQKPPAPPPPPPEDSAAVTQGAPDNAALNASLRGGKGRNRLRIDLNGGSGSRASVRNRLVYDKPGSTTASSGKSF